MHAMFLPACFVAVSYFIVVNGSDTGITCTDPVVENGQISFREKTKDYYKVKIRCDAHYIKLGNDVLKCKKNGSSEEWSANPPYCEEITCCKIPDLMNGTISPNPPQSKIGSDALISCDDGFLLIGPERLTCTIDGVWTPDIIPHCKEVTCPDFPGLLNGKMIPVTSTRPGTLTFKCEEGYIINGPREMTCTEDGHWTPNLMPACILKVEGVSRPPKVVCIVLSIVLVVVIVVIACMVILYYCGCIRSLKRDKCTRTCRKPDGTQNSEEEIPLKHMGDSKSTQRPNDAASRNHRVSTDDSTKTTSDGDKAMLSYNPRLSQVGSDDTNSDIVQPSETSVIPRWFDEAMMQLE